jgi:hypothetical protein
MLKFSDSLLSKEQTKEVRGGDGGPNKNIYCWKNSDLYGAIPFNGWVCPPYSVLMDVCVHRFGSGTTFSNCN